MTRQTKQNTNESAHAVIWARCPKHQFVTRNRLSIAIAIGVGEFNFGATLSRDFLKILNLTVEPALIAKSNIILDVKPWDDTTDMNEIEKCVRSVATDVLLWGAWGLIQSKFVPVGYGIRKLQISCVVEDDKVSTDFLEEEITKFEDYVQSVDIAAFNKV